MHILTDKQLAARYFSCFALGMVSVFLGFASPAISVRLGLVPPPETAQIVLQTPSQTVARIPTQKAGKRVDCTVIIDQAKNVWSITC
ncbi:MAG: hypothetical protein EPO20_22675 [Betaproteobacteria bacterium]|nr:MAG: hypothetical protein EPO20_22675 [Betaproteobacteria bacterium]